MPGQNEAIAHRYFEEIFNKGKLDVAEEIVANTCINHDRVNEVQGIGGVKELAAKYRKAFPDLHLAIEDTISQDDKVVLRWSWSGTHKGDLAGLAPTGKKTGGTGITIFRHSDGKIAESWVNWDTLGMLEKLGVVHQAG